VQRAHIESAVTYQLIPVADRLAQVEQDVEALRCTVWADPPDVPIWSMIEIFNRLQRRVRALENVTPVRSANGRFASRHLAAPPLGEGV